MVLYTTGCPQCFALKAMLDSGGYKYSVCDNVEVMLGRGIKAVPMLEVDGSLMPFKEAVQWVNAGGNVN